MFDYDWFHGGGLQRLIDEAKQRCAAQRFPEQAREGNGSAEFQEYYGELETRLIVYVKDGLTYEMRELADLGVTNVLAFECVPADDNYKVGAIVIVVPFEDIARVEVFAVHPEEKPQESFRITGFRAAGEAAREA
jgi:hypothetical protein